MTKRVIVPDIIQDLTYGLLERGEGGRGGHNQVKGLERDVKRFDS